MLANMASSLILHKRIKTTISKAKALRTFVEPLITKSKDDSTHSRRVVFSSLQDKNAVSELFREVAPKVGDRPGGYTRILKLDTRIGDNAEMCIIELVDYNANLLTEKDTTKGKSKRRRGTKKSTSKTAPDAVKDSITPGSHVEEETIIRETEGSETDTNITSESEETSGENKLEKES
jgi:large subunit ribosomal protein L17